jgi:CBS domain-containing protein
VRAGASFSALVVRHDDCSARSSEEIMSIERPVTAVMSRRPLCVRPETLARDALAFAREHDVEHLLVSESDNLVGVLCTCDLARAPSKQPVSKCMKSPAVTVEGTDSLRDAAALMRARRVGCLPVTAGGLLMGIVTRADFQRAGVPSNLFAAECASCGAHHHLAPASERGVPFCVECLECGAPNGAELGTAD